MRSYNLPLTKPYFPRSALSSDNLEYWIGRQEEIDRVVRGLTASTGTHYLITGYPGVGKSSFVSRAISEWRNVSAARGISRLLIFNLQFAKPQTPEEVVKRLIGKDYFASIDGQFAPTTKLAERLELTPQRGPEHDGERHLCSWFDNLRDGYRSASISMRTAWFSFLESNKPELRISQEASIRKIVIKKLERLQRNLKDL